ncbi:MAG: hypothetical protein LAO20_10180 [Acidobacteriia bacterium]|nr:hypothetical protein [Terriglobia bacterium]
MKKAMLAVCAIPFGCGLISTALFFYQGGFGGGHGRFDQIIFYLGLPSILFLEQVPFPKLFERSDLLQIIWVPTVINVFLLAAGTLLFMKLTARRSR